MYRAPNLHCIFHKTNNSWQGQDVVATPRTTTLIYAPRAQAETDVDDLKMANYRGKNLVGKEISCGTVPFYNEWVVFWFWLVRFKKV